MSKFASGLTLLFLTIFVAGCASTNQPTVKTETVYQSPPESLYPDCRPPAYTIDTNGDLARAFRDLRSRMVECHVELEKLKEWPDELE